LAAGVSSHCVVLTGAGVSTESGIPDFRSAEGIWARYDPAEVATIDAFRRDPARVWEFYALRLDALASAEPNDGHRALAELEGGSMFAVTGGDERTVVALVRERATPGLVFYDLKRCLAALADET